MIHGEPFYLIMQIIHRLAYIQKFQGNFVDIQIDGPVC